MGRQGFLVILLDGDGGGRGRGGPWRGTVTLVWRGRHGHVDDEGGWLHLLQQLCMFLGWKFAALLPKSFTIKAMPQCEGWWLGLGP